MDERIRKLKSTTFCGRRFTRRQLEDIRQTVAWFPSLSRRELAQTVCEHLGWRTDSGENSVYASLRVLEALAAAGVVELPEKDSSMIRGAQRPIARTEACEPGDAVECALHELGPVSLLPAETDAARAQFKELIDRYHYLGYRHPLGCSVRYFIADRYGRRLGCVLFQRATTTLPCRDSWIGWDGRRRRKRLGQVICNARFLILPWVRVPNLASHALSLAAKQVVGDWSGRWGIRPLLAETFVERARFSASSYRAAGWERIGETGTRSSKTVKDVYVLELCPQARTVLCSGGARTVARQSGARAPVTTVEPGFVALWRGFVDIVAAVADGHDEQWRRRRRTVGTLVVMLFVFRLVFSKNQQGYQSTINELWEHCHAMGVVLAQPRAPAASSMHEARAKVDPDVFRQAHRLIIRRVDEHLRADDEWCGRQLFAVDGSKLNVPRALIDEGYCLPNERCHYPQGLLSCLYRLDDRMPIDFELAAHQNERRLAAGHIRHLRAGDVVVYDRGYYSKALLRDHVTRGLDCVFRLQRNSGTAFNAFIDSGDAERVVEITAASGRPIAVRCLRLTTDSEDFFIATTLTDAARFPLEALSRAYYRRWNVEELYKSSKRMVEIEQFHSKTEHGVRQELFAHFTVLAMARSFGNEIEDGLNADGNDPQRRTNYKNALSTLSRNFETLMLGHVSLVSETLAQMVDGISRCVSRVRPGRSYERVSKRPDDRFRNANRRTGRSAGRKSAASAS